MYGERVVAADVRAARERVLEQAVRPSPGHWFAEDVMSAVGRAVGFDGYCLFGVDPLTGIRSAMFSRYGLEVSNQRLVRNENVHRDLNRYLDLAGGPRRAGAMAAGGPAEPRSERLHEMLLPQGYAAELRVALVSDGRYWGALSLFRDDRRCPFGEADLEAAEALSDVLAVAVRRYHCGTPGNGRSVHRPGVVLVNDRDEIVDASAEALQWLAGLADPWDHGATAEDLTRIVLEVSRAAREGREPLCRSRLPSGEWLVVSGDRLGSLVSVVLQAGDTGTVAPAFANWCGLSRAESRVLDQVVCGLAAKQIARRLDVSVLTVNDHLRSVYRKAHVNGREELLSLL